MTEERVRVREVRVLSDDWYVLRKTTFDYRRRDGTWQTCRAKPTTAATAPSSCPTTPAAAPCS